MHLALWNFARTCNLTRTSKHLVNIRVISQRSRSHGFLCAGVFACIILWLPAGSTWQSCCCCCFCRCCYTLATTCLNHYLDTTAEKARLVTPRKAQKESHLARCFVRPSSFISASEDSGFGSTLKPTTRLICTQHFTTVSGRRRAFNKWKRYKKLQFSDRNCKFSTKF